MLWMQFLSRDRVVSYSISFPETAQTRSPVLVWRQFPSKGLCYFFWHGHLEKPAPLRRCWKMQQQVLEGQNTMFQV